MKYTHLLEMSNTEPRQYRITVVEDRAGPIVSAHVSGAIQNEGFTSIGWYDTPEELMKVLTPYLAMEQGR